MGGIIFPGSVEFSSPSRLCILITSNCPNIIKILRVPMHEAPLFQEDLSVFLNEFTWYAEPACEDVLEFIAADPITPADVITGDGL